jgi:CO/xanthine dehydrogenase Mo-binding subunit
MLSVVDEFGAVVASASGNAIFAAVGVRLRYLPIRSAAVPEALGHA